MKKYVYSFEEKRATKENIFLLGNKGAQLAEMTALGLPVPPGFTISTEACLAYYAQVKKWPQGLEEQVKEKMAELESKTNKVFGSQEKPLLVSVRSGSYVSMPGMMDTVLNLGLNDETVKALAKNTNERTAWDSYRRFIHMFGDVVLKVPHAAFEKELQHLKSTKGLEFDTQLSTEDLKSLTQKYKAIVKEKTGQEFPSKPFEQLRLAINAVFESWNSKRAKAYRRIHRLREDAGTAVNVQAMVFGNAGKDSGTGVSFTRNPATGKKEHQHFRKNRRIRLPARRSKH